MKIALIIPFLAIFSALAILFGAVVTSNAGHHNRSMIGVNIDEMDQNGDGNVSFEEFSAFHDEQLRWSFNALDSDNNALISEEEWNTFLKMHGVGKHHGSSPQS